MTEQRYLRAYYHEFVPTGVDHIDAILEAIALAGKAYHSTEAWDEAEEYGPCGYWSLIQQRANEAAARVRAEADAEGGEVLWCETCGERDALAAENERLRNERVWQPIETAPMDGTKVDLWVVDPLGEGKRIPDCSWGWGQWIGSKGLAAERLGHKATHWIYRPTPPQE